MSELDDFDAAEIAGAWHSDGPGNAPSYGKLCNLATYTLLVYEREI